MRLRNYIWGVSLLLLALPTQGQQIAQYTQYLFNHYQINPAVAGSKPCVDMKLGYRRQWVGFEGAPTSAFANVTGRIKSKRPVINRGFHGVGAFVESDETGPTARTILYLSYAYHVPISPDVRFSAGLYAGIQQYRFDQNFVTVQDFADPALMGSGSTVIAPDVGPGIWLYSDEFYAGLSVRQMLANRIKVFGDDSNLSAHYALTAGRRFSTSKYVSWIPSTLIKFAPSSVPAIDVNLMVDFYNQFSIGASWRNTDAVAAYARFNFLKYFTLGYSFDFTTSRIRFDSANTHEVMIGIYACPSSKGGPTLCPAYQ